MITMVLHLLRLLPFIFGGHRQLALENVALRQQLAVYKRSVPRPRLRRTDRLFWIALVRMWSGWRRSLLIVTPDTVLRWCSQNSWGALKLGIDVAERTVSRPLPNRRTPPFQTWRTFLCNHVRDLVSLDFFTVPSALQPLANPFAERLIGSVRRECLNHVVVLGERHLRRILAAYCAYYHCPRTHLSLDKDNTGDAGESGSSW